MVGDLVCVRSWNTDESTGGWISLPSEFGIVIDVIEVEYEFVLIDRKSRCYDYVIYWIPSQETETIPDIILEKYSDWVRRVNEK